MDNQSNQRTASSNAAHMGLSSLSSTARTLAAFALGLGAAALLTGCGIGANSGITIPTAVHGSSFQGSIHGGQQPVVGATMKLYAASTAGYGVGYPYASGDNLLTTTITSMAGGAFDVTGDYTCPSASTPVYLVALQGNSGYTNNPNLALAAALGPCGSVGSDFVNMNEITTVATVYALAPFMTRYNAIGTTTTNVTGINNAFADVNLLTNIATGGAPGTVPAGVSVPVPEIYTLANIIAACVNTKGGTYNDGSPCGTLFYNANPGGTAATAPTDTMTALMNIAQHPYTSATNTANLYNLSTPTSPFQTGLTTQPDDFTLAVTLTAGNLNGPSGLAADASGNVFVANASANTVTEFNHAGTVLSGAGYTAGLNTPSSIAIDSSDIVWVTNSGNNTLSRG